MISLSPDHVRRRSSYKLLMVVFALVLASSARGQTIIKSATTKKDTTIILISDLHVQLECTQALNDLYNFNFPRAEFQFNYLKAKFPWHPLPYFLMGLIEWWKIMPNTKDTSHDDSFLGYMDTTIYVGENLYKNHPAYKTEAAFFLAAAYAFKGRLYSD